MKYLVSGITGTLGQAVAKLILANEDNELIGISRDEQKQRALTPHPRMKLLLGDVRDSDRMMCVSRDVDVLFHFAALKCVDTLEFEPEECLKTNVIGTENIMRAQNVNKIRKVVLSSTDKAVYPINVYGHSKALAERLVLANPSNIVCRYGNVVASRGSVVPSFAKTLREEKKIYITDLAMTRFWISIQRAAQFVFDSSEGSGINIPVMKSADVYSVAEAIGSIIGVHAWETEITGLRPGEKIHEDITHDMDSFKSERYSYNELVDLLKPVLKP